MIAFLTKSDASEEFDQIVDFLNAHMIHMVRNMDRPSKFLMYPRFLQLMINAQVDDLSFHNTKYTSPALKQKVFANMRRIGKGFSRVDNPLFDVSVAPTPPLPTPATPPPSPTQEHILSPPQAQTAQPSSPPTQQPSQSVDISQSAMNLLNTLLETCATLTKQVANLKQDKIAQATEITKLKQRGKIAELDADEDVTLVDAKEDMNANVQGRLAESQAKIYHLDLQHAEKVLSMQDTDKAEPTKVKEALKRKHVTEAQERKNMMVYLKNIVGFKMEFFRGMTYNNIRPIFEKHYNSIQAFLEKGEKEIEEEGSKRKGDSLNQDAAKKQKVNKEEEELKAHLQIVVNDDDDVLTEATPFASKVTVVDYQIHHENNKPYYKIIRADGTHKLFLSFITLLKNFDREDLEMLWKLVQERFQSSKPKNFSDDFLLNTFKIMFVKPNVEANIWRDQKGRYGLAKVKSWKLFKYCRVHIITLTTTQMLLLVEKKYPLTYFTLEQMLNNAPFGGVTEALGLLGRDQEWIGALQQAETSATSSELKLFVQIHMFCDVSHPLSLWKMFWKDISDDIPHRLSKILHILQIEKAKQK
nr:DNA helicase [Tanacetum cinerariifolium]